MTINESGHEPFKIDNISQGKNIDSSGNVIPVFIVKWSSPSLGNFTTDIPAEGFNSQEAYTIIQEKANELGSLKTMVNEHIHPQVSAG